MLRKKYLILAAAVLLALLCACGKTDTQAVEGPAAATPDSAAVSTAPETEPEAESETPAESEPVPETEPPREFSDADFNFFVDGFGTPDPERINITFYPGAADPNIRVWDSYLITNAAEIRDVCNRILSSDYYDFDRYGRTLDSMVVEWQAHNAVNNVYDNERTRHVDFNRADEGVTYLEFWQRAMEELTIDN